MKKLFVFGLLLSLGTVSCRSSCPAYTSVKPAQHQPMPATAATDTPVMASAASATAQQ
ncbi:hypothetical protein [Hymenobacter aerophilus]|uniref:hypothetical protein n=1 Tax=Hymenobacter aerophilus TaxID=119644 RepID=UPI0012FAC3C9|nr:hypothetical protein [Hymenobacter aerophilus]